MGNVVNKIAWSFSSIKAFEQCPKKYYHLRVAKDYKEPISQAMMYGTEFHAALENYVRDDTLLPNKFKWMSGPVDKLKEKKGIKMCEHRMGLTENLEPCGFYAKDVWYRGIVDLLILDEEKELAWVVDYKTGKSAEYADVGQLELMALAVFKHFPFIKKVKGGLLFAVCNKLIKEDYMETEQPKLWKKWETSYDRMKRAYDNDVWNPKQSGLCKNHCIVTECVYNGRN